MSTSPVLESLIQSNSKVSSPLMFLLSQKEVQNYLDNNYLLCKNSSNHDCIIESIKNLRVSPISLENSLLRIERAFKAYIEKFSEMDQQDFIDPVDVIDCILVNFHCYSVNQQCFSSEQVKMAACRSPCLLHNYFNLSVSENLTCKCGARWQNEWDNTNICQYFSTSMIFEGFDKTLSDFLVIYPKYALEKYQVNTCNSVSFKGKLLQALTSRLRTATSEYCKEDDCVYSESSVTFEVKNSPTFYIIDLIQETHEYSHLQSFLLNVTIDLKADLQDIYSLGRCKKYRLEGVFFYNKKLRFAQLIGNYWKFPGIHSEATWYDVMKEALVMNLHPVAVVYKEFWESSVEVVSDYQLKKMEQVAVQCDLFKERFNSDVVHGESSGFFTENRKNRRDEVRDSQYQQMNIEKNNQGDRWNLENAERVPELNKNWKCSCGNLNSDEFELCTKCNTLKTGVNKWVCNKCSGLNEITSVICELCGDGYKSQSSFENKFEPRHNFISQNMSHNREDDTRTRDQYLGSLQSPSQWVCKCSQKNSQDFEVCIQCFELKPGLSGWICKKCKLKNDDYSSRCSSCRASKEGGLIFDQEFWICEKCKTAISNLTSFCDTCMISRSDTGFDEKCKICFKNKVYVMDKCLQCYMTKKEDEPPNREEIKSDSKWKCKYCPCWNYDWESKCRSCSRFKDMNDTSKWICSLCSKDNFVSDDICWYCKTMKEKNKEIEINKTKCQKCGMSIDYVRCVKCGKLENYLLGFCGACKSDLSSITTCHTCFKPDWINSYGKMNEPQPNNPVERKLGSLYKSFNSRH